MRMKKLKNILFLKIELEDFDYVPGYYNFFTHHAKKLQIRKNKMYLW